MTGSQFLAALACRGVHLELAGDALRYRAPTGAIGHELRAAAADLRPLIVAAFRVQTGRFPELLDPRPDRTEDADLWSSLLRSAYGIDADDPLGVYGALLGMRCCGAALLAGDGSLRLSHGELPEREYAALRRELQPHAERIRSLFSALALTPCCAT